MKLYRKKYKLIETYGVFFVDFIAIALSYYLAHGLRLIIPFGPVIKSDKEWFPVYALCILGCALYNLSTGRYEGFFHRGYLIEFGEVLKYNVVQFAFLSIFVYVFRLEDNFSRILMGYYLFCYTVIGYIMRVVFKKCVIVFYKKGKGSEKVLIITDGDHLETVLENIQRDQGWSYEIVGVALTDGKNVEEATNIFHGIIRNSTNTYGDLYTDTINGSREKEGKFLTKVMAGRKDLIEAARQMPIDIVFFYCNREDEEVDHWIQSFSLMGIRSYYCVQKTSFSVPCSGVGEFANFPVMCYNNQDRDWRMSIIKRVADILGSIIGLTITIILIPFISIAIKLEDSKGPVFFSQTRIGKNGRRFHLYKFRSMYVNAEEMKKELMTQNEVQGLMFKMENDPRVTKVGKFLRRTSLDELPQFWNILKGDMSLVGTRPPTEDEFEQYNDYYRRRMSITPGLTGLWQVSGRSDIKDFNEVVKLDLQYIDNWSIGQDIKILLQTFGVVISGKGSK